MSRQIGLAPLSSLSTPPDQLVRLAAATGFSFAGLRVIAVTPNEPVYDLSPGSPLLAATQQALKETGLYVLDTEFLQVNADTTREAWLPALEAAGALEAKTFTIAAGDDNIARLTDTIGAMVDDARDFGVTPALEPISYRSVHSIPQAAAIARDSGAKVVADTLHMARFGATPEELTEATDVLGVLQLCDSPLQRPADLDGLVTESRSLRLAPGEGEQNLLTFVNALDSNVPLSVETPNDGEVASRGDAGWINHLYNTTQALLEKIEEAV